MIAEEAYDMVVDDFFMRFQHLVPDSTLFLKIEGLNPAGSVKLKTAIALVEDAETSGRPFPGTRLIESSSGNLGIALAVVCAAKGYPLTCVTDPNANSQAIKLMKVLGADVVVIDKRDANGGFLQSRIDYIHRRLLHERDLLWLNQYANHAGPQTHCERTGSAILTELGHVDHIFIGAGTTGTLMGVAQYFRKHSPETRITAVDAVGSVTFGGPPARRHIPGLGTSRRPEILDTTMVDEVVLVSEEETVEVCRLLAKNRGLLVGGSTGSVIAGVRQAAGGITPGSIVAAISADLGDRYLDTIYDDEWVAERWPEIAPQSRRLNNDRWGDCFV
ncbi:2,3-diaminopropionate biosynthesis protein SbnA [Sphaerimonospora cavernae]|uniref:2,3-diaminopropionate biosynthesis protein SbnA n=1 Tax=Sphaerimonospora cavernae TaxID=1740611 RepID=A0ABV6U056_9ACTN